MGDASTENEMIEIGDPSEDGPTPEAPAPTRVVIEYRDRGVPWMLIPPMLALAAVGAVLAYPKLVPPPHRRPAPAIAPAPDPDPKVEPPPAVAATPPPPETPSPFELALAPPEAPAPAVEPAAPASQPEPFPRVQALGFDPKALEADRNPAAPGDPQVVAARVEEPPPAARPEAPAQPVAIDPDLLPPDPKLARIRRENRAVEARRKVDDERGQFHAELRAITRRLGAKAGPEINELCKRYGTEVDAEAKARAARALTVVAAGADRPVRINLLRSLGFPESLILMDLFGDQGRWESKASRTGARSEDELMVRSALILLNHPPGRVATRSRPVSSTRHTP